MQEYAKAWAGAAAALIAFVVGEVWIELPEPVTGALATVITGAVVWAVRNRPTRDTVKARVKRSRR